MPAEVKGGPHTEIRYYGDVHHSQIGTANSTQHNISPMIRLSHLQRLTVRFNVTDDLHFQYLGAALGVHLTRIASLVVLDAATAGLSCSAASLVIAYDDFRVTVQ